jgi:drug/metabolite transporter (DMT)-like permease
VVIGPQQIRIKTTAGREMPRSLEDFAVFSAPAVFVLLWASGFIGAKFGLPYAGPMTFLSLRMIAVVALLAVVILLTHPKWPDRTGLLHSAITGTLVHGLYLGGVFASIENGISAGLIALIVSLQPVLTSTMANRWLGERVLRRQWLGLLLGLAGVYLIVRENIETENIRPIAWVFATTALAGITTGTLYQKRFGGGIDWRPALCVQYATAGILFTIAAFIFETRVVHWTP